MTAASSEGTEFLGVGEHAKPQTEQKLAAASIGGVEYDLAPVISLTERLGDGALLGAEETSESDRSREVFRVSRDPETYEVTVESDVTLEDYKRISRPADWALLEKWAEPLRGKTVSIVNPTMAGGGVAMMRPPLVHLMREFGIDAHWFVMEAAPPDAPNPFIFTKKMHNIIQRRVADRIDDAGMALHQQWSADNAESLEQQEALTAADVVIIDDPQPTPLIPRLKALNPEVKIVWRNHIDNDGPLMSDPTTSQGEVWTYLRDVCGVGQADAYVFHPDTDNKFVPFDAYGKTYLAPATIEPYDDMNRELSDAEIEEGLASINAEIAEENQALEAAGRHEDVEDFIDPERDRFVLIARFDESKGMDKMMALGVQIREEVIAKRKAAGLQTDRPPQVIIIGNGSVDDPSGPIMLEKMRQQRRGYPEDVRQDIILKRLKHNYMAMNAVMYNQSEEAVLVAAQLSDAEGCETRITDWIRHGIPVVVANRGGMPLQIIEGLSGTVLDFDQPDRDFIRGTEFVSDLMVNPAMYRTLRESTLDASRVHNEREYTTVANSIRWLRILNGVLAGKQPDKLWKISELSALSQE